MGKVADISVLDTVVRDGMTLMSSGFMGCGAADTLIDYLVEKNIGDITLISTDTAIPEKGAGKLIVNRRVKKLIASHIGTNPETGKQMNEGTLEVELVPQGTLAEKIRSGGYGLGGVLTPTGLGTVVEEGKKVIEIEGKDYILELPLRADVAFIRGSIVDKAGNVYYKGTTRNFCSVMAMAADIVVVEAEKIVEVGELQPECIMTPGAIVGYVILGGNPNE